MSAVIVIFCALISTLLLWKTYFSNRKRAANLPPLAPGALPIVGHIYLVFANRKRLYQIVMDTILGSALKNGANAVTISVGTRKIFVIMNPDDAYLLSNECLQRDLAYKFFKPLLGDEGLITADVPVWKRHRKLLNPVFNQSVLDTYLTEFNEQSRQLVEYLDQEVGKGLFNQLPYLRQAMLQLVCATSMGGISMDESDLIQKLGEAVGIFTECIVERFKKFWYYNEFLYNLSNLKKKHEETCRICQEAVNEMLRRKKAKLNVQKCEATKFTDSSKTGFFKSFTDFLLDLSKKDAFTESEIKEEITTYIGAGFDTTYHALGITLLILGSYPEVQQKVFEELQEVLRGSCRDVERQDLSKLIYLEAVVKETMRLYPIVAIIGRMLDKDLTFKNYTLPAGSRCFISIYHIGRHPVWGPDAEQFRPERWLDGSLPSNTRAFAVFGLGKRSCIGSNYAMMTIKTVLSYVVRRYRISGDVTQLVQSLDIVVTPVSGHHISIERRED